MTVTYSRWQASNLWMPEALGAAPQDALLPCLGHVSRPVELELQQAV